MFSGKSKKPNFKAVNTQAAILKRVFRPVNLLGVFVVTLVPPILGLLQDYFGATPQGHPFGNYFGYNLLYSFLVTSSLFFGCAYLIESLNHFLPWKGNIVKRIFIEILLIFSYSSLTQFLILGFMEGTPVFREKDLSPAIYFDNILFSNTITLIVVSLFEGSYFFRNWKESLVAREKLEKEHAQSKYANLKAQLDPHFMFNSLNVLSGLIRKDPAQAEAFVDDFARVYRYLLEVKNEMVVPLKEELQFAQHYLNLQKSRFREGLVVETHINPQHLLCYLPPLSLQELVSNAIKHNRISAQEPLHLEIISDKDELVVRNNLQNRRDKVESTGVGLDNLKERYRLLGPAEPRFLINGRAYLAYLPLLKPEE